ncbi:MAG: hypothetical protein KAR37_01905, partial [Alphaproteobacteria bacterium]|nr:hypothetical protein [Alphaproteobacteria bacterium]
GDEAGGGGEVGGGRDDSKLGHKATGAVRFCPYLYFLIIISLPSAGRLRYRADHIQVVAGSTG